MRGVVVSGMETSKAVKNRGGRPPTDPVIAAQARVRRITEYRRRQPVQELLRKAGKATRRGFYSQEEIDLATILAEQTALKLHWHDCDAARCIL